MMISKQSEDGGLSLELLRRDGGATTAYGYEVIIKRNSASLFDKNQATIFKSYGYPIPVDVIFLTANTIQVKIDDGSTYETVFDLRTLKPEQSWDLYKGEQN